jgi:hypothetical protein
MTAFAGSGFLPTIADLHQIRPDQLVQLGGLLRLLTEFGGQALHFVVEWFAVVFGLGRTDVTARRQDVAVLP